MPSKIDKRSKLYEICRLVRSKVGGGSTIQSTKNYLESLERVIFEQLELNGEIVFPKFGRFYLEHIDEKEVITNEHNRDRKNVYIPERDEIRFTPYKEFKERINKKYGTVSTHLNAKDIPMKATIAELFQTSNEKRKEREDGKSRS